MKNWSRVEKEIKNHGCILTVLIDPDEGHESAGVARASEKAGAKNILIGGSSGINQNVLDDCVKAIKENASIPVGLFPGDLTGISEHADYILYMSLLNSQEIYYHIGAQVLGAPIIKRTGIETVPTGYLVIEPGGETDVGYFGSVKEVPRSKAKIATTYALAAEYLGMKVLYLETGSGAKQPAPPEMVAAIKKSSNITLIVGGGIRTGKQAMEIAQAGADIINVGTIIEETRDTERKIKEIVKGIKKGVKARQRN